jgi:hypothetical protein
MPGSARLPDRIMVALCVGFNFDIAQLTIRFVLVRIVLVYHRSVQVAAVSWAKQSPHFVSGAHPPVDKTSVSSHLNHILGTVASILAVVPVSGHGQGVRQQAQAATLAQRHGT